MVNTPNKHGLRAAAEQRTARHAQRTLLSPRPRPRAVEDANELARCRQMATADLRAIAFKLGIEGYRSMSKGKLLDAILAHESARPVVQQSVATKERRAQAKADDTMSSGMDRVTNGVECAFQMKAGAPKDVDPRGGAKAASLYDKIASFGWMQNTSGDVNVANIVFTRGTEVVQITWIKGVFQYEGASYCIGDRITKIRNASHAAKLMARPTEEAESEVKRIAENKKPRERKEGDGSEERQFLSKKLSFDTEQISDKDLVNLLLGKGVRWRNAISDGVESAYVGRSSEQVRVIRMLDGDRVFQFCCPATGFRAFRLSALLRVSAKVDLRTREASPSPSPSTSTPRAKQLKKVKTVRL